LYIEERAIDSSERDERDEMGSEIKEERGKDRKRRESILSRGKSGQTGRST